jgi:hypothetical protein
MTSRTNSTGGVMGIFNLSDKYGPALTEPPHFQKLREIADKAAIKAVNNAAKDAKKGPDSKDKDT